MKAWFGRNAPALAWVLWAISLLLAAGSVVFLVLAWSTPPPTGTFGFRGFATIFALAFGTVGAIVASRLPRNPIGWLMLAVGLLSGFQETTFEFAIWAILARGSPTALAEIGAWVPAWIWIPGTAGVMLVLFVFPDGHLLSPRWRWAVAVGIVGTVVSTLGFGFASGPLENFLDVDNPFGVGGRSAALAVANAGLALYGVGFILGVTSVVLRFRRSSGDERQQLRWLVAASGFLAGALLVSFVGQVANTGRGGAGVWLSLVVILGFMSFPLAMGVAILKFRLYDLDVVIRKTVVFGILVVLLTAIFVVVALGIGGTVTRVEEGGSVLPAFLVAFGIGVLTVPLWRLSRRIADRVVFGGRSTPYEVLSEFAARVSETYAADDVAARMGAVLGEALGATEATVWLWLGDRYRLEAVWPPSTPAVGQPPPDLFEVRHQGDLLGALGVRQPVADPMNPSKEHLARDLAAQAGPVLRNVRLIGELRESRRRIVAAQDARAKKLERDIHDGAQQQLVALAVKQRLAESFVGRDDERVKIMLHELQSETSQALDNLRDLARGVYPPLLADQGLEAAVQAQARKSTIPMRVEASGLDRYPPEVESALYFSILEALQNVSKYAGANDVVVRLRAVDGSLAFDVTDDGRGFDPGSGPRGSGLLGMADRLAAIGGELDVVSAAGEGTSVRGRVPVSIDPGSGPLSTSGDSSAG